MSARPSSRSAAHRAPSARTESFPPTARIEGIDRVRRIERRRRLVHLRRRRRDLLEDTFAAVVLMIFALIITPGLGVLALIEVPVALALIGSVYAERRFRKRRREARRSPRRSPQG